MTTTDLKKCEYCSNFVGITNELDYPTHLKECGRAPENLPCRSRYDKSCEYLSLFLRVGFEGDLAMKTTCEKTGCFKSVETTRFPWWEVGVPVSGPDV
jgi:hypothetical protein